MLIGIGENRATIKNSIVKSLKLGDRIQVCWNWKIKWLNEITIKLQCRVI